LRNIGRLRAAHALQSPAAMKRTLFAIALLAGCAGRETAWTTLPPADLPDGGDAFVLVDGVALHVSHVEHDENGFVHARVRHAWSLPAVGVAALADDTRTTSPETIAHRAGWPELHLASTRVAIPEQAIRSARGTVEVEPDEPVAESRGADVAVTMLADLIAYALTPEACRCHAYRCH
jgi:hypothetical protein